MNLIRAPNLLMIHAPHKHVSATLPTYPRPIAIVTAFTAT